MTTTTRRSPQPSPPIPGGKGSQPRASGRERAASPLAALNQVLASLGNDPAANIAQLTAACGRLLGGSFASYLRLEGDNTRQVARWRPESDRDPDDLPTETSLAAPICLDRQVTLDGEALGALSVLLPEEREPLPDELDLLESVAQVIGVEERRLRAEAEMARHDRILHATTQAASLFSHSTGWEEAIYQVMARMGEALEVDRVYVCANRRDGEGGVRAGLRFLWSAEGHASYQEDLWLSDLAYGPLGFARWQAHLGTGKAIFGPVDRFPASERDPLRERGVSSLAAVPIFAGGGWWGFLGLESHRGHYRWSRGELEPLRTLADALGAAIDRQRHVQALQESEERYRLVVENADEGIMVTQDRKIRLHNPKAAEIMGRPGEDLTGLNPMVMVVPQDRDLVERQYRRRLAGLPVESNYDFRALTPDGELQWINMRAVCFRWEGQLVTLHHFNDVTRRRVAEEDLKAALEEKDALLREIHHRVKNNMQVVSSLLSLQGNQIDSPQAVAAFDECRQRVRAMALVHELIYQSDKYAGMPLDQYLLRLLHNLFNLYGAREKGITYQIDAGNLTLMVDQAVTLGLVLNELISNSLKHAYPHGGPGQVALTGRELPDGRVEIRVADDGQGLPQGLRPQEARSLGLHLVIGLVSRQLRGTLEYSGQGGTAFTITFSRESLYEKR